MRPAILFLKRKGVFGEYLQRQLKPFFSARCGGRIVLCVCEGEREVLRKVLLVQSMEYVVVVRVE
jgi:hypothetical protein